MILSLILLKLVYCSDQSRYCYNKIPFSGYRFQIEISEKYQYNLIYCIDNKLIFKSTIASLTQNFTNGENQYTILQKETNLFPNRLLGSLLLNGEFLTPLLSDNYLRSWIEITHDLKSVLHIPVLTSPKLDSKYAPVNK